MSQLTQSDIEQSEDDNIDLERLATDIDYWNKKAPDEAATHFCTQSGGFEYLDFGGPCDTPKPGTEVSGDDSENLRKAVRRLKAFIITHHGAEAKVLKDVNEILGQK